MQYSVMFVAALAVGQAEPLGPGDHKRIITVDGVKRQHYIHIPPKYDPKKPAAVVLALHGASMWDKQMATFTGLSATADKHNFIVVYPNGTGIIQTWNAGLFASEFSLNKLDDVKYLGKVLDDVESVVTVDKKRVHAAGLSNGAMMSYRLAAEMSDRIGSIATIAGTLALDKYEPKRAVSVVHFHGTKDTLVPYNGPEKKKEAKVLRFRSVDDTMKACIKANGCAEKPIVTVIDMKEDKLKVIRREWNEGKNDSEVVLYVIEEGGHTWPGMNLGPAFLGASTKNIDANEILWEFFKKHPLK
jgi:polyhydroxybutyrate depolymerase